MAQKEFRKMRSVVLSDEIYNKARHKCVDNNISFSAYIEALILKDLVGGSRYATKK